MILEDAISFLRKYPPFQFLDETTLRVVAGSLSMDFFPKDTVILRQEGDPSDALRIIKKGAVKVTMRSEDGEDVLTDLKGEGDNFGFLSMIGKDRQKTTVVAIDDTLCYTLSKETVLRLLESSPAFTEYYMSYLSRYVDRTYREMQNRSLFYGSTDRLLFTTPVGDVATRDLVTVREDMTIQEAAQAMSKNRVSSLVVIDKRNLPAGIVTDRDLREKVVAKGRNGTEPVKSIMTISLIRVDAEDSCFEAVLKMVKYNIHHILVVREGALYGIMTNHDLMLLQGVSPLSISHYVENQQTIEGLVPVSKRINNLVGLLLKEGAKASSIVKIITEINDRLVRKVLEIAEKELGQPPVPYCWIAFGSEGRREQTFKTDQDNAVIYADVDPPEDETVREYFLAFTAFVKESLVKIGFPPCPAGYMADNPQWCQPLRVWKKYFSTWISEPFSEAVLKSLIFFDFRPLYGKFGLAEQLQDFLTGHIEGNKVFLGHMANMITKNTSPIGFLKSFVVEKSGEHKNEFNLKVKGIALLVDAVRLFALERAVRETSTLGRVKALRERHTIVKEFADELEHAFEFIMLLRIQHQFERIREGREPDNFINPDKLSNLEKKTMREAFHLISKLQGLIIERYKPMIM